MGLLRSMVVRVGLALALGFRPSRAASRCGILAADQRVPHPVAVDNIATAVPHLKAGKLRALAVTSAQRSGVALDVPTLAESGLPGFELSPWQAVFAPAGTPKPVIDRQYTEIAKILKMPEVEKRLTELGLDLSGMPPAQLGELVKADVPRLGKIVKESGARAE